MIYWEKEFLFEIDSNNLHNKVLYITNESSLSYKAILINRNCYNNTLPFYYKMFIKLEFYKINLTNDLTTAKQIVENFVVKIDKLKIFL